MKALTIGPKLVLSHLHGGVVQYRPAEGIAQRTLSDYELVLIIEGQVTYTVEGTARRAMPGHVILARPGLREEYLWDPRSQTRHAYFHFGIDSVPSDWPPQNEWPNLMEKPDPAAGALFRHIVERIASHPEWPALKPSADECSLIESLIRLLFSPTEPGRNVGQRLPEPVHHALNLMRQVLEEEPHRAVKLDDVAQRAGVSEKHLCRLFRKSLGHSPMNTFRLLKLQLALALLSRSNLAMKEIADRCGFNNPLYFSRCFAQTYGAPPTAIRKHLRQGGAPPPAPLPPDITPRIHW